MFTGSFAEVNGGCITKLEFRQIRRAHPAADCDCKQVRAFVYPVKTDDLCAEDGAGISVVQRFYRHLCRARIVLCMGGRVGINLAVRHGKRGGPSFR